MNPNPNPNKTGDGKKDRFPSQNRLAFAFQEAHKVNSRLQRSGAYNIAHTFMAVETAITQCSDLYEQVRVRVRARVRVS